MSVGSETVAITGASGFIGRYLHANLTQAGYCPRSLGRTAPDDAAGHQTDYSFDSLCDALAGADALVHLAGRRMTREDDPTDLHPFYQPNVAMISDLVRAAKAVGIRRLVLASTIAVYAPASGLPYRENAKPDPINAYALSKLMAEQYLDLLTRDGVVSSVALRFAAVYGHGEKGTPALMKFIGQAQAGQTIVLSGNPDYRIDQLYVRDATSAIVAALESDARGSYNIGGGRALPVLEIAQTVNDVFENKGNLRLETDSNAPMPETYMALDAAAAGLNWQPAYDLRRGLEDFRTTHQMAS